MGKQNTDAVERSRNDDGKGRVPEARDTLARFSRYCWRKNIILSYDLFVRSTDNKGYLIIFFSIIFSRILAIPRSDDENSANQLGSSEFSFPKDCCNLRKDKSNQREMNLNSDFPSIFVSLSSPFAIRVNHSYAKDRLFGVSRADNTVRGAFVKRESVTRIGLLPFNLFHSR